MEKDRRKPWQKTLQTLKVARCGSITQETARQWKSAALESDRHLNAVGYGRNGEGRAPSVREVQYYRHMTEGDSGHSSNISRLNSRAKIEALNAFLRTKGVLYA